MNEVCRLMWLVEFYAHTHIHTLRNKCLIKVNIHKVNTHYLFIYFGDT